MDIATILPSLTLAGLTCGQPTSNADYTARITTRAGEPSAPFNLMGKQTNS